ELHKVLVPPRGLFVSGKFDQYKRDIPYSTLVQALQSLVRPLLGKSDAELKLLIGKKPPVPGLRPQDTQRRFQLVFRRFLGVFARSEHPLALFLDDLQWLDAAALALLHDLMVQ